MNSCGMAKKNGIRREKETILSLLNNETYVKSREKVSRRFNKQFNAAHIESHLYVPFTTFHSDDEFSLSF